MSYDSISIIYNPNSTGESVKAAKELNKSLQNIYPKIKTELHQTNYAGHAKKLAYKIAKKSKSPLIISSSGDGGYNEVINGAIEAQLEGANPICAVIPAGNANDHSRTLQNDPIIKAIKSENIRRIDLLKISVKNQRYATERYAHSYIGFGLTPVVAVELNKTDINKLNELWIVLSTFYKYRPFKIRQKSKVIKIDSIIFTNISQMAKILTISKFSKPDDGLFEVIQSKHGHKLKLLKKLTEAALSGLEAPIQANSYEFEVIKKMPVQLDGEVVKIRQNSTVRITSEHRLLRTIL